MRRAFSAKIGLRPLLEGCILRREDRVFWSRQCAEYVHSCCASVGNECSESWSEPPRAQRNGLTNFTDDSILTQNSIGLSRSIEALPIKANVLALTSHSISHHKINGSRRKTRLLAKLFMPVYLKAKGIFYARKMEPLFHKEILQAR